MPTSGSTASHGGMIPVRWPDLKQYFLADQPLCVSMAGWHLVYDPTRQLLASKRYLTTSNGNKLASRDLVPICELSRDPKV